MESEMVKGGTRKKRAKAPAKKRQTRRDSQSSTSRRGLKGMAGSKRRKAASAPRRRPKKPREKRPGRKSRLTHALIQEVCGWIENGHTVKRACLLSGVPVSSFYLWLRKARDGEGGPIELELLASLKVAEAKYIAFHLNVINQASSKGDWKAALQMLRLRKPKEFTVPERFEGKVEGIPAGLPKSPLLDDDAGE